MPARETVLIDAAHTGGEYANRHFGTAFSVDVKSNKADLVTDIDRMTQRRVVSTIRDAYPDDHVVGEEEDELKTVPDDGYAWIIDPIDGTTNYVHGIETWATSVALVRDREPVNAVNLAPTLGTQYQATRSGTTRDGQPVSVSDANDPETFLVGATLRWRPTDGEAVGELARAIVTRFGELRRLGSAQLSLSMVADGALDAVVAFDPEPNPWDTVAGAYLVTQAGGTVTDVDGNEWEPGATGIVASNGHAHDAVLDAVQTAIR